MKASTLITYLAGYYVLILSAMFLYLKTTSNSKG